MPLSVDPSHTLSISLFRVSIVLYSVHDYISLSIQYSLVPTPAPFISNSSPLIAGTLLNLSCDYTLSISVDTDIIATATWTINDMPIAMSDGVYLIFSPLTTSYTGNYICTLTLTPSSATPHVTIGVPVKSSVKVIIVQSKVHPILHVLVHIPLTSLSHSHSLSTDIPLFPFHLSQFPSLI